MKKIVIHVFCAIAIALCLLLLLRGTDGGKDEKEPSAPKGKPKVTQTEKPKSQSHPARPNKDKVSHRAQTVELTDETSVAANDPGKEDEEDESPEDTEEAKREREAEQIVEDFDSLTDKWMEPAKDGITMKDVDAFVEQFRKIPDEQKDECIHRALNLVPDENIMLLAGVLMDKSQSKETMETVFNDILNRSDNVKDTILLQIFKDREHPCWADTAWILDATGELSKDGR